MSLTEEQLKKVVDKLKETEKKFLNAHAVSGKTYEASVKPKPNKNRG